ncbi:unnamed protein product [Moneuplotes crassus]|uniref:Uncharacterized protein n=1 Tax=Euplotes crassus TaxID=5936 RepID=A0AAD1XM80_EUPCR|nr:unnamed protein product [Moneuplotes crassus]
MKKTISNLDLSKPLNNDLIFDKVRCKPKIQTFRNQRLRPIASLKTINPKQICVNNKIVKGTKNVAIPEDSCIQSNKKQNYFKKPIKFKCPKALKSNMPNLKWQNKPHRPSFAPSWINKTL